MKCKPLGIRPRAFRDAQGSTRPLGRIERPKLNGRPREDAENRLDYGQSLGGLVGVQSELSRHQLLFPGLLKFEDVTVEASDL